MKAAILLVDDILFMEGDVVVKEVFAVLVPHGGKVETRLRGREGDGRQKSAKPSPI